MGEVGGKRLVEGRVLGKSGEDSEVSVVNGVSVNSSGSGLGSATGCIVRSEVCGDGGDSGMEVVVGRGSVFIGADGDSTGIIGKRSGKTEIGVGTLGAAPDAAPVDSKFL
ncbi:hypothetical protein R1sor_012493 [Riccia sorocarpa]|uniref:Uncharacterized protein n=1 Tax=Riccia sorocarpa TaxID=122646 RepID=A0ABD3I3X7_9MARC